MAPGWHWQQSILIIIQNLKQMKHKLFSFFFSHCRLFQSFLCVGTHRHTLRSKPLPIETVICPTRNTCDYYLPIKPRPLNKPLSQLLLGTQHLHTSSVWLFLRKKAYFTNGGFLQDFTRKARQLWPQSSTVVATTWSGLPADVTLNPGELDQQVDVSFTRRTAWCPPRSLCVTSLPGIAVMQHSTNQLQ